MRSRVQQLFSFALVLLVAEFSTAADTLPLENGDIHDIYGPIALSDSPIWLYFVAAVLIILVLFAVWFFLFKKRQPQTIDEIPIREVALAELAGARQYLELNLSLKYARKVSLILRNYLEMRFNIHSTRQTTTEFLTSLEQISSSSKAMLQPYRKSLQICLEQFDLAKYAHKTTQRETMEHLEESIRTFILETSPRESE